MTPDFRDPAFVHYAEGWVTGRGDLITTLAERRDNLEATWETVIRPTWDEQVAARVAEMETVAAGLDEHFAGVKRSNAARDFAAVRNGLIVQLAAATGRTGSGVSLLKVMPNQLADKTLTELQQLARTCERAGLLPPLGDLFALIQRLKARADGDAAGRGTAA